MVSLIFRRGQTAHDVASVQVRGKTMRSLSQVHVEVAIKDELAATRRQIEALAQHPASRI